MRIQISPVTVNAENGSVLCEEAEVSVAVSNSTAVRLVPVGPDGTEYPDAAMGIVGDSGDADVAAFMATMTTATATLAAVKGI